MDELLPNFRSDIFRPNDNQSFADLEQIVVATFDAYSKIHGFMAPWNARQIGNQGAYLPPEKEQFRQAIKRPRAGLNDLTLSSMLTASVKFCEQYKGKKQLPTPHPSTHHSAHFPTGSFELKLVDPKEFNFVPRRGLVISNLYEITVLGAQRPFFVYAKSLEEFKFMIVRPKLSKLGTASASSWEALFFRKNHGFLIEHTDSALNPRYSGIF